jgi:NAD-dependent dihydropyrimidine dehydrogenase PreA subunit
LTYVIAQPCIDVKDKSCVEQCPVDCIYEGVRAMYINPGECIECGACEPACPVEAVYHEADLPAEYAPFIDSNRDFFILDMPGRSGPLGNPGGYRHIGPMPVDTALVHDFPSA